MSEEFKSKVRDLVSVVVDIVNSITKVDVAKYDNADVRIRVYDIIGGNIIERDVSLVVFRTGVVDIKSGNIDEYVVKGVDMFVDALKLNKDSILSIYKIAKTLPKFRFELNGKTAEYNISYRYESDKGGYYINVRIDRHESTLLRISVREDFKYESVNVGIELHHKALEVNYYRLPSINKMVIHVFTSLRKEPDISGLVAEFKNISDVLHSIKDKVNDIYVKLKSKFDEALKSGIEVGASVAGLKDVGYLDVGISKDEIFYKVGDIIVSYPPLNIPIDMSSFDIAYSMLPTVLDVLQKIVSNHNIVKCLAILAGIGGNKKFDIDGISAETYEGYENYIELYFPGLGKNNYVSVDVTNYVYIKADSLDSFNKMVDEIVKRRNEIGRLVSLVSLYP